MKLRKILSLVLALALCAGLVVIPAGAYDQGKVGTYTTINAATGSTTAVIDPNGSLWTWGCTNWERWDPDSPEYSTPPTKIMDDVASVSFSYLNIAVLKSDGTLWTWGPGHYLGNGTEDGSAVPVKIMDNVIAVSYGYEHAAAIQADGSLWMWGSSYYGELGNGSTEYSSVPVKVMDHVAAVSCGNHHTAAIKTDGTLWTWGDNTQGELGNGGRSNKISGVCYIQTVPFKVMDNVSAVSCGGNYTAAIQTDGSLWTWGYNYSGELGNGNAKQSDVPVKVMDNVVSVCCGQDFTAAIQADGSLWTWGLNDHDQLGNGGRSNDKRYRIPIQTVPLKIMDNVSTVSCGVNHSIALKTDGTLWTWGSNLFRSLGYDLEEGKKSQSTPRQVPDLVGRTYAAAPVPPTPKAYPSTQMVELDGKAVEFQCYALKDQSGNPTNYIKLRDLAMHLGGSAAQFDVGWDGKVTVTSGKTYTPNGTELSTPFTGERPYKEVTDPTNVNGKAVQLSAFVLTDDAGGGYTYYKLRDLGQALGFNVDWSAERGVFIETDKPYGANS